jgi:TetR/AcrR family transcriptional regulator
MTPRERTPRRRPGRPAGPRAGEAREALLAAAHELMAEKGYPRVTVREVAERAGVQAGLVNYHFGSKTGLLRSAVGTISEQMLERVRQAVANEGSIEDRIRALIRGIVEAITAAPYGPRLIVEQILFADADVVEEFVERFARPNLTAILELLEEGRRDGSIREVDPRFMIPSMVGSCVFFFLSSPIVRRLYDIEEINAEITQEFAEHTAELILHGISTQPVPST